MSAASMGSWSIGATAASKMDPKRDETGAKFASRHARSTRVTGRHVIAVTRARQPALAPARFPCGIRKTRIAKTLVRRSARVFRVRECTGFVEKRCRVARPRTRRCAFTPVYTKTTYYTRCRVVVAQRGDWMPPPPPPGGSLVLWQTAAAATHRST